jgi:hypothetical protein
MEVTWCYRMMPNMNVSMIERGSQTLPQKSFLQTWNLYVPPRQGSVGLLEWHENIVQISILLVVFTKNNNQRGH